MTTNQAIKRALCIGSVLAHLLVSRGYSEPGTKLTEKRLVASDGASLCYQTGGTGAPVIILSGGPGFAGSMLTTLADTVAEANTVVLLDQRGTGKSRKGNEISEKTITMGRFVDDIEELRAVLKVDKITLLGHSWGGALAMAYAAEHPERIRGLVLLCSSGPDLSYQAGFSAKLNGGLSKEEKRIKEGWRKRMADANDPDPAGAYFGTFRSSWGGYVHDRISVAELDKHLKPEYSHPDVTLLMVTAMEGAPDTTDDDFSVVGKLTGYKGQAFIIFGESDPMDMSVAEQIKREIPQAEIITVEKTGHYPWIEQPESFNKLLLEKLSQTK